MPLAIGMSLLTLWHGYVIVIIMLWPHHHLVIVAIVVSVVSLWHWPHMAHCHHHGDGGSHSKHFSMFLAKTCQKIFFE